MRYAKLVQHDEAESYTDSLSFDDYVDMKRRSSSQGKWRARAVASGLLSIFAVGCGEQTAQNLNLASSPADSTAARFTIDDPPILPIVYASVVESVTDPVTGQASAITFQLTSQVDSIGGAAITQDYSMNSTPAQDPSVPGSVLIQANSSSFSQVSSTQLGSGIVPPNGENSPLPANSSILAPHPDTPGAGAAYSASVLGVHGDLTAAELASVRSDVVMHESNSRGDDSRQVIAENRFASLRHVFVDRDKGVDSLTIDGSTGLLVREALHGNGRPFHAQYEYTRIGNGIVVQTLAEFELPGDSAGNLSTIRRRLTNVHVK